MRYVVAGNTMVDTVRLESGVVNRNQLGGPGPFAYAGVKLFTDDCLLHTNVGQDFAHHFERWITTNKIDTDAIAMQRAAGNNTQLIYYADGTYGPNAEDSIVEGRRTAERLGALKVRVADIAEVLGRHQVAGLYIAERADQQIWEQLGALRRQHGLTVCWELESVEPYLGNVAGIVSALRYVDLFSLNLQEAQGLFATTDEDELLVRLAELNVPMVQFRVGERGLYTLHDGVAYFHPSAPNRGFVDATGCGNMSTGAALWAYCQSPDPIAVGIASNIASAYNVSNWGVIEDLLAIREQATADLEARVADPESTGMKSWRVL